MQTTTLRQGTPIWDLSRIPDREVTRLENPDLVRFRGAWYCLFQEAPIHMPHPGTRLRIIRSVDGKNWESVKLIEWKSGSLGGELSITAEGSLMLTVGIYYVSEEARPVEPQRRDTTTYIPEDAKAERSQERMHYQLDWIGTVLNIPLTDEESLVTEQRVVYRTWDGDNWGSAEACETITNTQAFRVSWHGGMAYCVGQWGKDMEGCLYRSRDGIHWRELTRPLFPEGHAGEAQLAFGTDGTAYALLRGDNQHGVFLGSSPAPYYQAWSWCQPEIDYGPDGSGLAGDLLGVGLGGPRLQRLSDGRLLGAGRALGPNRDDGRATLFLVDPDKQLLTVVAEYNGTSYPGVCEHDGKLWVVCTGSGCHDGIWEIHLATVDLGEIR